ncbi:hypothetical protein Psuf_073820 [Phytohabitans suffuscus]|uniref:Uncharacterized protein n=1 Tax=Phytohabitans suffuscus TaxID=624315 RepID=A0A6F8YVG8_9ACTN|nr:hypothetical protein Psuf_073820 [Phytohabitans suffuscus]
MDSLGRVVFGQLCPGPPHLWTARSRGHRSGRRLAHAPRNPNTRVGIRFVHIVHWIVDVGCLREGGPPVRTGHYGQTRTLASKGSMELSTSRRFMPGLSYST